MNDIFDLVSLEAEYSNESKARKWDLVLLMHSVNHRVDAKVSVWIHWFLRENTVFEHLLKIKPKLLSLLIIFARIRGSKILVLWHAVFHADSGAKKSTLRLVSNLRMRLWKTIGSTGYLPDLSNIWRQNDIFFKAL